MNKSQTLRFNNLYKKFVSALNRQGLSESTIDCYSRSVRRITEFYDQCPDQLTLSQLEHYFECLVQSHSWSTVKVDRNGLQFFYSHVLKKQWKWVEIVKPPVVKSLPDILTVDEISQIINATREIRYQTFILITYSMGLRLGEALNLTVADIDAKRSLVHVRQGKGRKDRFVFLPQRSLHALRVYWCTHRNKKLIFPNGKTPEQQCRATQPMDRGGLQKSFKAIVHSCNIHKKVTIHTLRHCYGTHLVEAGVNLRAIQTAMGHECPKTTARYTQYTAVVQENTHQLINSLVDQLSISWGCSQ